MSEPATPTRFTLRDLPLPAKLVVTVFLLAVGLGYTSAMIQLHMQHGERDGKALPTPDNVVAVFAGKKWVLGGEVQQTVSKLEEVISGSPKGSPSGRNMTPAFFAEDGADFERRMDAAKGKPHEEQKLLDEREGDRRAMLAWINAAPEVRKRAYQEDKFLLPPELAGKPMTAGYKANGSGVHIWSLIRDRCTRCHGPNGDKSDFPLKTYEQLSKYLPASVAIPEKGGWVDSGKQISLEKLTQSTHAHLLSFAMLFALTGVVFAFSSFPGIVRGILGPGVLVAQVADVSCWWLARLPVEQGGPIFAYCILGTGTLVATGLGLQIVLSLFSMYGRTGRMVLVLFFAVALGLGGAVYMKVVRPYLDDEKRAKAARANGEADKPTNNGEANPPATGPSPMETLLAGQFSPGRPFNKKPGGMILAFFNKEPDFKFAMQNKDPDLPKLTAEREGELAALVAWVKATEEARKKAYEDDAFVLPPELASKPLTAEFKANDTTVKVRALITKRCAECHKVGGDKENAPLTSYDEIAKYLKPEPATGAKADAAQIPMARE
jgi:mono/diheme cytochrome c family protein